LYACICHAVTNAEVDAAIAVGADSVRAVRRATGAGQSCGSCVKRLSCLLSSARAEADGVAAAETPAAAPVPAAAPAAKPVAMPAPAAKPTPVPVAGLVAAAVEHLAGCPAGAVALG
jgi:bacterioferritin-associated ferredoxin